MSPRRNWDSPTPSRQRVCPSPRNQKGEGGTHACGCGVGGVPTPTTGEKLITLPTLRYGINNNSTAYDYEYGIKIPIWLSTKIYCRWRLVCLYLYTVHVQKAHITENKPGSPWRQCRWVGRHLPRSPSWFWLRPSCARPGRVGRAAPPTPPSWPGSERAPRGRGRSTRHWHQYASLLMILWVWYHSNANVWKQNWLAR